jgi:hypothetical protein
MLCFAVKNGKTFFLSLSEVKIMQLYWHKMHTIFIYKIHAKITHLKVLYCSHAWVHQLIKWLQNYSHIYTNSKSRIYKYNASNLNKNKIAQYVNTARPIKSLTMQRMFYYSTMIVLFISRYLLSGIKIQIFLHHLN